MEKSTQNNHPNCKPKITAHNQTKIAKEKEEEKMQKKKEEEEGEREFKEVIIGVYHKVVRPWMDRCEIKIIIIIIM